MADSQPLEASIAAVTASSPTTVTAATATTISAAAAITTSLIPSDNHTNTVTTTTTNSNTNTNNFGASLAPKRQRRPSVRLGEIGGDGKARRPRTTWRFYKDPTFAAKASKTRPITNLVTVNDNGNGNGNGGGGGGVGDNHFSDINFDIGKGRTKSKKPSKKVKTNWTSLRLDSNGVNSNKSHANSSDNENDNRELREFELEEAEDEGSESPVHSIDNVANEYWQGNPRMVRARVSDNELPELNSQDRKCSCDGVREWLIGLGLSRYSPVFEIHEVDDEVLPMLTLEDLKDMGINAVGSRRKMYTAILKLRKGFS